MCTKKVVTVALGFLVLTCRVFAEQEQPVEYSRLDWRANRLPRIESPPDPSLIAISSGKNGWASVIGAAGAAADRRARMVRIINLAQTLEKMAGELERRLRASHLANWQGRLTIAEPREQATLAIDRSKVKVIKVQGPRGRPGPRAGRTRHAIRGGDEIARLLSGSDEPQEVIEGGKMRLSGDARRLAAVLFPNEHPMLSAWDRF